MIAAPVVAAPVVATALLSRGNDDDGSLLFMEEFMENLPALTVLKSTYFSVVFEEHVGIGYVMCLSSFSCRHLWMIGLLLLHLP